MNRRSRTIVIVLGVTLLVLVLCPFLVPITRLEGTVPPQELADPDSRFIEIDGVDIHYKMAGEGEPAIILLHGFGASLYTWRSTLNRAADYGTAIAFDRPPFGLTERPLPGDWQRRNPYTAEVQADLTVELIDRLGFEDAILVGHSAGGTTALLAALRHPARVRAMVLISPAVYIGHGTPSYMQPILNSPQARRIGPLFIRSIIRVGERLIETGWYSRESIDPTALQGYLKPLQADDWDRALWELIIAGQPPDLAARLSEVRQPVLLITGDSDRIVPTHQSIRLSGELPDAQLAILESCGHLPQEQCPSLFLVALGGFLQRLR